MKIFVKKQPGACNVIKKETPAQVFSCEFCKNFENSFFYRAPLIAARFCPKFCMKGTLFYSYFGDTYFTPEAVFRRCFVKKVFFEILQNSQENTCARVSFLKRLWHRCFSVNFAKFLRTPFFTEHLRWLPLLLISLNGFFDVKKQPSPSPP